MNNTINIGNIFLEALKKTTLELEKIIEEQANETPKEKPLFLTKSFLMAIDWRLYENVCVEYLVSKNCKAKKTPQGADQGIDIKITNSKNQLTGIAQCKRWRNKVGVHLVREFFGVMTSKKIDKGIFFTTSYFTYDAIQFCKDKKILLINGDALILKIDKLDEDKKSKILAIATTGDYMIPTCANCDIKMIERTARKGRNIGNKFWGCSNYPHCRSTMQISS
jgi:restriction system protein